MAGGEGTRLRPLTSNQPKPMVSLCGKPCMEYIVELLKKHGFDETVVTLMFLPKVIRDYFGDGSALGVNMQYSVEQSPAGTAGSVKLAEDHLRDDTFIVISGDALTDFDLSEIVAFHKQRGAMVTIALKRVENPLEFGVVVVNDEGRIERFLEKPTWGQVFSDTVNTGIYVLEPEVFDHIPADEPFDFSQDLFPKLFEMGAPLYGYVAEGYWQDIGSLPQYLTANCDLLDGKVEASIPGIELQHRIFVGDLGVVADEGRSSDVLERVEVDALADEDAVLQLDAGDAGLDLAVQEVAVGREVLGQAADVLPVALGDVAVQRRAHLEELGEQVLAEVEGFVGRDVIEHLRLEHVDARVDRVAEHLAPSGFLEETLDAAFVVDHHDAELERVLDALECDGDHGAALLVKGDDLAEVEVGEGVAADDDEGVVPEMVLGQLDAAGGAGRRLLDGVLHAHAEGGAVAEVVADDLGKEHERDDGLVETVLLEELDDVLHAGLAAERHHRLGLVARERPQAGAFAAGHDDCTHGPHLRFRSRRRWDYGAAILPRPRLLHPHDGPVAVQQAAGHVERRAHGEEAPAEDAQVEDEPLDRADEDEVAGLAPAADLRALVREAARRDDQRQDDAVADQQRQHGPPRQRAEGPEHSDEREEEEAVDDRVHPAAELALHVVPARDEAIGDVAERREEDDPGGRPGSARRGQGVRPDDERQRQEPGDGEDIGHVAHEALHAGQSSRRGGQATQPPLPGGRADRPGGLC